MRAALVVCCLLFLTLLALHDVSAAKRKRLSGRPRRPRSIWSSIRRNTADIRRLTRALNEDKQFGQGIGPIVDTLKDNVDNMKEGFASQTMMIRKLTTATNATEQSHQELNPVIDALKDDVDDMKKDFASMTLMMARMQTSINDMKDLIGAETEAGSGSWKEMQSPKGKGRHQYNKSWRMR